MATPRLLLIALLCGLAFLGAAEADPKPRPRARAKPQDPNAEYGEYNYNYDYGSGFYDEGDDSNAGYPDSSSST